MTTKTKARKPVSPTRERPCGICGQKSTNEAEQLAAAAYFGDELKLTAERIVAIGPDLIECLRHDAAAWEAFNYQSSAKALREMADKVLPLLVKAQAEYRQPIRCLTGCGSLVDLARQAQLADIAAGRGSLSDLGLPGEAELRAVEAWVECLEYANGGEVPADAADLLVKARVRAEAAGIAVT